MKIITVSGASGSGKSTLATHIHNLVPDSLLLSLDRYYLSKIEQIEKNGFSNFDDPAAIDSDLLKESLNSLKKNGTSNVPIYDFTVSQRAGYETVSATNTIIIEGLFSGLLLANESDLNVFIDVDLDLALLRRIQRDITERGRTVESVTEQYIHFVRPAYFKHIENIKSTSDIILKNNSSVDQFIKEAQNIIEFVGLD